MSHKMLKKQKFLWHWYYILLGFVKRLRRMEGKINIANFVSINAAMGFLPSLFFCEFKLNSYCYDRVHV